MSFVCTDLDVNLVITKEHDNDVHENHHILNELNQDFEDENIVFNAHGGHVETNEEKLATERLVFKALKWMHLFTFFVQVSVLTLKYKGYSNLSQFVQFFTLLIVALHLYTIYIAKKS